MASEKTTVQVTVTAKDEASGTLNAFIKQLDAMGREGQKAGAGIRNLVQPLAYELAPALGTTGGALARVAGSAALATTGFGALAIAVTSLAGLVAGQLTESWKKAREEQEKWSTAFAKGDVAGMTAEINKQADAVRKLGVAFQELPTRAPGERWWSDLLDIGPGGPLLRREDKARALGEGITDLTRKQRLKELTDVTGEAATYGPEYSDAEEKARIALIVNQQRLQRGLYDFTLDPLQAQIRQRQREAADLQRGGARDAAGRLLGTIPRLRDFTLAGQLFGQPLSEETPGFGLEQISDPTMNLAAQAAVTAGREARLRRDAERQAEEDARDFAFEFGGGAEAIGVGPTPKETAEGARDRVARLTEARDLEREMLEIASHRIQLTDDQRDALAAQVIEATRLRDIEAAGGDERRKDLANARAEIEKFNLELTRIQREDPLAGLAAGFRDVADEANNAGSVMRRFAQETARGMQQSFSDLFFNVMTGNFKSLEDIGKNFGLSVARSLSNALAANVSAPILGLLGPKGSRARRQVFSVAPPRAA